MFKDSVVYALIAQEEERQRRGLELIASENFVSEETRAAMGSVLTHKYAEGLPSKRYYGGCEVVDKIESLAIERAKKLFRAQWANVQPHSGAQANAAVMLALLKPGDTILGFDLFHGGHLTHGSSVNFSGKLYRATFYGVSKATQLLNYEELEQQAYHHKPRLIICGASSYSRDWDYQRIRRVADSVGALLLADISHPSGLIAKGLLNDPLDYCHIVSTTTHKTLRGPRGGLLLMRNDIDNPMGIRTAKGKIRRLSSLLDSGVFPGTQGGPLEHVIAAKAIAFGEALQDDFSNYTQQVQKNAQYLAKALESKGYNIVSGGTDNHMLLVDLRPQELTGKVAEDTLIQADITVNKNIIPFDEQSPLHTSGIRIGTAALTTRGLKEKDMVRVATYIDEVLLNREKKSNTLEIKHEINHWMKKYPLYTSK